MKKVILSSGNMFCAPPAGRRLTIRCAERISSIRNYYIALAMPCGVEYPCGAQARYPLRGANFSNPYPAPIAQAPPLAGLVLLEQGTGVEYPLGHRPAARCAERILVIRFHHHNQNTRTLAGILIMEQGTGVEPALTAWEAAVIPIYQPCITLGSISQQKRKGKGNRAQNIFRQIFYPPCYILIPSVGPTGRRDAAAIPKPDYMVHRGKRRIAFLTAKSSEHKFGAF